MINIREDIALYLEPEPLEVEQTAEREVVELALWSYRCFPIVKCCLPCKHRHGIWLARVATFNDLRVCKAFCHII